LVHTLVRLAETLLAFDQDAVEEWSQSESLNFRALRGRRAIGEQRQGYAKLA
jgi:hypothetical protein